MHKFVKKIHKIDSNDNLQYSSVLYNILIISRKCMLCVFYH